MWDQYSSWTCLVRRVQHGSWGWPGILCTVLWRTQDSMFSDPDFPPSLAVLLFVWIYFLPLGLINFIYKINTMNLMFSKASCTSKSLCYSRRSGRGMWNSKARSLSKSSVNHNRNKGNTEKQEAQKPWWAALTAVTLTLPREWNDIQGSLRVLAQVLELAWTSGSLLGLIGGPEVVEMGQFHCTIILKLFIWKRHRDGDIFYLLVHSLNACSH